jgi:hypothetical protein
MNIKRITLPINPMQAGGVLARPVADEVALDHIATCIALKFGVSVSRNSNALKALRKSAQGCSRNVRAALGKCPTKQFSLASQKEERAWVISQNGIEPIGNSVNFCV